MSVNSKMTAIADEIRTLTGTTGTMGLDAMATNLGTANENIASAYTAASEKGATMPDLQNSSNLASTIQSISSGVELNFDVVGGTTEPTSASENTIWVNTDTEITGWTFAATEPDLVDGYVWFKIGSVSPVSFNALQANNLTIYPLSAKQCVDGAWVNVTVMIYQDGWIEWSPEGALYWHGDECTEITGGWTCMAWKMQSDAGTTAQTYEITRNDDNMTFTKTGLIGAVMRTTNKIDLTDYATIQFKGEMYPDTSNNYWARFLVLSSLSGNYWASSAAATVNGVKGEITTEFTLDISSLEGEYYIGFGIYDPDCYVKVEELYMEVA